MNKYIVGSQNVPSWLKNKLMPYQKMNGSVAYELHTHDGIFNLNKGDVLRKVGSKIWIRRKVVR